MLHKIKAIIYGGQGGGTTGVVGEDRGIGGQEVEGW